MYVYIKQYENNNKNLSEIKKERENAPMPITV